MRIYYSSIEFFPPKKRKKAGMLSLWMGFGEGGEDVDE
jgi:hypothetical protein